MKNAIKRMAGLFCALLLLAGCSGGNEGGFAQSDLALTVAGKEYHLRDNIETVLENLGDGYQYAEGKSCDYEGLDKTYTYETAIFYTNPLAEGDLLREIYSDSPETVTTKGIAPGAAREDVIAAYGVPAEADEYLLIYRAGTDRKSVV